MSGSVSGSLPWALVVTCHDLRDGWQARMAVRRALPDAWVTYSPFRGVLLVESDGDPLALADRLARSPGVAVARIAAVLAEVPSDREAMIRAVREVAPAHVGPAESFAVRLHKRGSHGYVDPAPELEREAGTVVSRAMADRDGHVPHVDLEHPDVTVHVEVLGPRSLVCVARAVWSARSTAPPATPSSPTGAAPNQPEEETHAENHRAAAQAP